MTARKHTNDTIQLIIPASAEYAMLARLVVAGLGTRQSLSYEDVEDLRVIVAEVCRLLVGEGRRDGTVHLRYGFDGDAMVIEGKADSRREKPEDDELSLSLLTALSEACDFQDGETPTVRVVKKLGA